MDGGNMEDVTTNLLTSTSSVANGGRPTSSSRSINNSINGISITNSSSSLRAAAAEFLECPICLDPCVSPIYSCKENGHLCCGFCREKMRKNTTGTQICSICKSRLFVNAFAERLSRSNDITLRCRFWDSGCTGDIIASKFKEHIAICEYRDIICFDIERCPQPIPMKMYSEHLLSSVHKMGLYSAKLVEGNTFITELSLPPQLEPENDEESRRNVWSRSWNPFKCQPIKYDEKEFIPCAVIERTMVYWWLVILGGQKDADNYTYETKLIHPRNFERLFSVKLMTDQVHREKAPLWQLNVLPYHMYNKFDELCGLYACENGARLSKYFSKLNDECSSHEFCLEIKIIKTDKEKTEAMEFDSSSINRSDDYNNGDKNERVTTKSNSI